MTDHLQRAQILLQQKRFALAERELRGSLALAPGDALAHALLAVCISQRGDFHSALLEAEQAIHLSPEEAIGHTAAAVVYRKQNLLAEAERSIRQALQLDPSDPDQFGFLADLQIRRKRWSLAQETAERGLALDPQNQTCLYLRSTALLARGNRRAASRVSQDALELNPEDPLAHVSMGTSLLLRGHAREGQKHISEALRLNPELLGRAPGVIEELKAHSWIWKVVLSCLGLLTRLRSYLILGIFVKELNRWPYLLAAVAVVLIAFGFLADSARNRPELVPWAKSLAILCLATVVLMWNVRPISTAILGLSRLGRTVIPPVLLTVSACAATCGVAAAVMLSLMIVLDSSEAGVVGSMCFILVFPVFAIYACRRGGPRVAMICVALGLVAITAWGTYRLYWHTEQVPISAAGLLLLMLFVSRAAPIVIRKL